MCKVLPLRPGLSLLQYSSSICSFINLKGEVWTVQCQLPGEMTVYGLLEGVETGKARRPFTEFCILAGSLFPCKTVLESCYLVLICRIWSA